MPADQVEINVARTGGKFGSITSNRDAAISDTKLAYGVQVAVSEGDPIVVIRDRGQELELTREEFYMGVFAAGMSSVRPLIVKVIGSLLNRYELLGYQISQHFGNLTQEEYELATMDLRKTSKPNSHVLKQEITNVFGLTGQVYTSDQLSLMLDCDIEDAESALNKLLSE